MSFVTYFMLIGRLIDSSCIEQAFTKSHQQMLTRRMSMQRSDLSILTLRDWWSFVVTSNPTGLRVYRSCGWAECLHERRRHAQASLCGRCL